MNLTMAAEQPHGVEIHMADGIFIKQMIVPKAGTYVPQHSHTWDHVSMLAVGSIRVWKDGVLDGDYTAPTGIMIKAGVEHTFLALVDQTILYCVHNIGRTGEVEIIKEHQIVPGGVRGRCVIPGASRPPPLPPQARFIPACRLNSRRDAIRHHAPAGRA
jgi:quercetin dioxygenase-like cupin family protein